MNNETDPFTWGVWIVIGLLVGGWAFMDYRSTEAEKAEREQVRIEQQEHDAAIRAQVERDWDRCARYADETVAEYVRNIHQDEQGRAMFDGEQQWIVRQGKLDECLTELGYDPDPQLIYGY